MTEVDTDYRPPKKAQDESQITDRAGSTTKMSDQEPGSMPYNMSTLLEIENAKEEAAFKNVIKELVSKDQSNALDLEERILQRMKKENLSKGWVKPTGAKVAPLKVLQSLSS